jgi:hypothetical protein
MVIRADEMFLIFSLLLYISLFDMMSFVEIDVEFYRVSYQYNLPLLIANVKEK